MAKLSLEIVLLFLLIFTPASKIFARAAGALDRSFGSGGISLFNISNGSVHTTAVQPDGKILVGGSDGNSFLLMRYGTNGAVDTSFGLFGFVRTPIFAVDNLSSGIYALAIQPDGKIVAVGYASRGTIFPAGSPVFTEVAVARYNADGTLDNSFDGDGKTTTLINNNSGIGEGVAIQPDGKIVVAAWNSGGQNNFVTLRLHPNGAPDNSFDGDGMAITSFGGTSARTQDIEVQPDGKILTAGYEQTGILIQFALARYNADGSPDNSFGENGKVIQIVYGFDYASAMTLQPDGKIIVSGATQVNINSLQDFCVVRLNPNGSLDQSFGDNGRVRTAFDNNSAAAMDVALQPDGRIVVAGIAMENNVSHDFAVARYLPNGALDVSFSGDGRLTTSLLGEDRATAVAIHTSGKIIVAGDSDNAEGDGVNIAVVRYHSRADALCDFDGDGKSDIAVFRPSSGFWYISGSLNNFLTAIQFGASGDLIAPADFDGDGKTDVAVFRSGTWYRLNSSNNQFVGTQFGTGGDVPVPGDFDGDQKADVAVFRPSNGFWYRLNSNNNQFVAAQFGANGDKPQVGDFDGDGKTDLSVFRPSNGSWYVLRSSNNSFFGIAFGIAQDVPTTADFDGDGKTDIAVYRPSAGSWYRLNSSNNQFVTAQFGAAEDKPAAADFDGDGRADLAVFRPSNGTWYLLRTTAGFTGAQFGTNGDLPAQAAFGR